MGSRMLAPALGVLLLASRGLACDPVLLQLIRGQDKQSEFDRAVEQVSTRLGEVAAQARAGTWDDVRAALTRIQRDWIGLYASNYLSEAQPASSWQATFDVVSRLLGELEAECRRRDFEKAHLVIRDIQDRLIVFYRGRAAQTPAARFARARDLARSLAGMAAKPNFDAADAGAVYLYIEREMRELPKDGAERAHAAAHRQLKICHDTLKQPAQLRRAAAALASALERFRQEALDRLWFHPSRPDQKETTK